MKHLYSLIIAALCSLVGMDASAFTLFVDIDDVSRISEITTYPAQSGKVNLAADEISVEFDDNNAIRYITVTAVSGKYITGYKFVDEDGRELAGKSNATGKLSYIAVPKEADYGRMIITTADALKEDAAVKVTLVGDPNKVTLSLNAKRNYTLVRGEQTVEFFSSTEGTWYIMPKGVTTFYKVTQNGTEVKPTQGWEGSYQYTIRVSNGDELRIETDFPNVKHNVTLTVPEGLEGIVESVTVDGTAVDNWKQMQVKSGARLVVTLNDGDYRLTEFTINGSENLVGAKDEYGMARFINSWATLVEGDITMTADGILVERPYRVTMRLFGMNDVEDTSGRGAGDNFMTLAAVTPVGGYYFARSTNKPQKLVDGAELPFCDDDNPFFLELRSYSETDDVQMTVMVNDEIIEGNNNQWQLTFKDGDVLGIFFGIDPAQTGIRHIKGTHSAAKYNVAGQRVDDANGGLYIIDGKKILVK